MSVVPPFSNALVESISKVLGDCGSGSEITDVLAGLGLDDHSEGYTKWRRLNDVFLGLQKRDGAANGILGFIRSYLEPARFVGKHEKFEDCRKKLNEVLAFSGLEYGDDAEFRKIPVAKTLTEAERRANTIRAKFQGRRIHDEVLKYCKAELMQDNSFHAVLYRFRLMSA